MRGLLILFFLLPFYVIAQQQTVRKSRSINMGIQPNLVRGPYLQCPERNSIVIRWRTDVLDRSRVKYGTDPEKLLFSKDDSLLVHDHEIKLTDLRPGTKYYYSLGNFADTFLLQSKNLHFTTLPENENELHRVMIIGDMGNGSGTQRKVRDAMVSYVRNKPIHAWLTLGDNVYSDGSDAEFQKRFFEVYQNQFLNNYGFYTILGNHDYHDYINAPVGDADLVPYYKIFSVPYKESKAVASGNKGYYSFDIGNVHYIVIDSYGKDENGLFVFDKGSRQYQWLEQSLAASALKKWRVVLIHHPPYSKGSHDSDTEVAMVKIREVLTPVWEAAGVDLVISGHSHLYERSYLIKGHTGLSNSFNPKQHALSMSSGKFDATRNSIPYVKSANNNGTVYIVAGSGGQLSSKTFEKFPHSAHYYSNKDIGGALFLTTQGNVLNMKWLAEDGDVKDEFTILKNINADKEKLLNKLKIISELKPD